MNSYRPYAVLFLGVAAFLFSSASAKAYTSDDYYKAGLQLYNAQNYSQASQYFSAAIQMDPNNAAALQGRANCNYSLGQYQQALDDYQRVQALQPNPQLASMIQALQAKLGTAPSAAPPAPGAQAAPPVPGATAGGSFDQGVAAFQQQQYAQAAPLFQKAVQENPGDANAYYYLGASQMQLGDLKDAAVALGLSNKLKPNPGIENYVNALKARLSPDDQQWVDSQIARGTTGGAPAAVAGKSKAFGLRFEPSLLLLSLADFNTNAQSWANEAQTVQTGSNPDPSMGYNGAVPAGAPNIGFEPVLELSPNMEVGLPIGILGVGTATDKLSDSNGTTFTDSYSISGFSVGADFRYIFGTGDWRPYVCAGGMIVPISLAYSGSATFQPPYVSGYLPYTASGTFTGVAVGGQISAGLDWHLGDTFVVTPFAGFQFASGNSFQATNSSNNAGSADSGQSILEVVPTSVGNVITPVSNGKFVLPVLNGTQQPFASGSAVPNGSRPLSVDLGGPYFGVQLAGFF